MEDILLRMLFKVSKFLIDGITYLVSIYDSFKTVIYARINDTVSEYKQVDQLIPPLKHDCDKVIFNHHNFSHHTYLKPPSTEKDSLNNVIKNTFLAGDSAAGEGITLLDSGAVSSY